jgi:hypothetical protein
MGPAPPFPPGPGERRHATPRHDALPPAWLPGPGPLHFPTAEAIRWPTASSTGQRAAAGPHPQRCKPAPRGARQEPPCMPGPAPRRGVASRPFRLALRHLTPQHTRFHVSPDPSPPVSGKPRWAARATPNPHLPPQRGGRGRPATPRRPPAAPARAASRAQTQPDWRRGHRRHSDNRVGEFPSTSPQRRRAGGPDCGSRGPRAPVCTVPAPWPLIGRPRGLTTPARPFSSRVAPGGGARGTGQKSTRRQQPRPGRRPFVISSPPPLLGCSAAPARASPWRAPRARRAEPTLARALGETPHRPMGLFPPSRALRAPAVLPPRSLPSLARRAA